MAVVVIRVAAVWFGVLSIAIVAAVGALAAHAVSNATPWATLWTQTVSLALLAGVAAIQLWRSRWSGLIAACAFSAYFIHCNVERVVSAAPGWWAAAILLAVSVTPTVIAVGAWKWIREGAGRNAVQAE